MKKHLLFLFSIFSILGFSQTLEVQVNKNPALTNEVIQLQFIIKAKGNDFIPPSLSNFHILSGPHQGISQNYSYINGKSTREIKTTISYTLQAKKEGSFIIPSASVKVEGKRIKSKTIKLKIEKSNTNTTQNTKKENNIFVKQIISKNDIFVGEQFSSISKIYIKEGANIQNSEINAITYDGFWEDEVKINTNKQKREIINGVPYRVIKFRHSVLTSQKDGDLFIPSTEMKVMTPTRGQLISNHPFFGPQYQTVLSEQTLKTRAKNIKVRKLPQPIPKNFYGIVSEKFTVKTETDKTKLKTSEAISYKITFRGNGNINMLEPFDIKFPSSFEVFSPTITDKTFVGNNNTGGKKTFEYILIPREEGIYIINSIKFNYFNPETEKYIKISTKDYKIEVEKGKDYVSKDTSTTITNTSLKFNGFSKIKNRTIIYNWFIPLFWSLFLLLFLSILIPYILSKRTIDTEESKRRKSTKIAIKRLKNAQICLKNNDFDSFFEEIEKSLWGYFADKFNVNSSKLSKETIEDYFNKNQISSDLQNQFINILSVCEFARYSPSSERFKKMEETLEKAKLIIVEVESNLKRK